MKRKLIRQGADALTLTLPREWTRERGLEAGQEVDVEADGDALVVRGKSEPRLTRTSMHLAQTDVHGYRHLLYNAYRKGFDEIKVTFDKSGQFAGIREVIGELMGFEITQQGCHDLTLKSVALPDAKEYPVLWRRTFHIVQTAFDYLLEDMRAGQFDKGKVYALRLDLLRLTNFCKRVLHTTPAKDKRALNDYLLITLNDYAISQLWGAYATIGDLKRPGKLLASYVAELKSFYGELTQAIFKEDLAAVVPLTRRKYALYELKKQLIRKASAGEREAIQELSILARLLTDYVGPLSLLTFKESR
jgi:antitoxin component of MazEF toxin-antitoxin module